MLKRVFSKSNYYLIRELVRTDFKLRYQSSVLGYLWSLLKPLMLFAILYTVFTKFLRFGKGIPNFALSLLLGIVLWSYFAEATSQSLKSIVSNGSLIRKIKIPKYLIPASTVIAAFINLVLNLVVVFIFLSFAKINGLSWATLIALPLLIIELTLLAIGVGLFLSAVFVRFRDMDHIWDVVRQALFYTIPIIYPITLIPLESIRKAIMLNPLAQIIQDARFFVTYDGSLRLKDIFGSEAYVLIPLGLVALALLIGTLVFRKESKNFSENV